MSHIIDTFDVRATRAEYYYEPVDPPFNKLRVRGRDVIVSVVGNEPLESWQYDRTMVHELITAILSSAPNCANKSVAVEIEEGTVWSALTYVRAWNNPLLCGPCNYAFNGTSRAGEKVQFVYDFDKPIPYGSMLTRYELQRGAFWQCIANINWDPKTPGAANEKVQIFLVTVWTILFVSVIGIIFGGIFGLLPDDSDEEEDAFLDRETGEVKPLSDYEEYNRQKVKVLEDGQAVTGEFWLERRDTWFQPPDPPPVDPPEPAPVEYEGSFVTERRQIFTADGLVEEYYVKFPARPELDGWYGPSGYPNYWTWGRQRVLE